MQEALSAGAGSRLIFYAFDLPHLDGWDLTAVPLAKRKELLAKLLAGQPGNAAIHFSDHVAGNGPAFFEQVGDRASRAWSPSAPTPATRPAARRPG